MDYSNKQGYKAEMNARIHVSQHWHLHATDVLRYFLQPITEGPELFDSKLPGSCQAAELLHHALCSKGDVQVHWRWEIERSSVGLDP